MAAETTTRYKAVWQTWDLVRPRTTAVVGDRAATDASAAAASSEHRDWRQQVQTARVERRWSVSDLAVQVQCDAETLAAFERGDEILAPDVQRRIRRALGL